MPVNRPVVMLIGDDAIQGLHQLYSLGAHGGPFGPDSPGRPKRNEFGGRI